MPGVPGRSPPTPREDYARGQPPHPARHPLTFTHDKRKAHYGLLDQDTAYVQVTGGGNCTVANKRDAMGVPWMTGREANEAIPPAYTEFIGFQLIPTMAARKKLSIRKARAKAHSRSAQA